MEVPRPDPPKKRKKVLLGKGPFALLLGFCFFIGLVVGFFLTLSVDPFTVQLKESPFGPELVSRLPKGRPFDGLDELKALPEEVRKKYLAVLRQDEAGDMGRARPAAAALAAAAPKDPLLAGTAAYLHIKHHPRHAPDLDMAAALWTTAAAAHPDHPWLNYVGGLLHEKAGRPDSALSRYLRAFRASPQFAFPHAALGRLQLERGETGRAASSLRKAIGLMTTAPEQYRPGPGTALPLAEPAPFDWLATLYVQAGAPDSARMALEYGLEKGWKTDRMAMVQGWLWEASGFLPKADSIYRRLLAQDPGNPEYARSLATLGWKSTRAPSGAGRSGGAGDRSEGGEAAFALSLLDPLARQYPGNGVLWMALGQAYYHRGLYNMALEAFDSSLKADPGLPGLKEKRLAAYEAVAREEAWARASADRSGDAGRGRDTEPLTSEEQAPVVLPGAIALLGTYSVPWGSTPVDVRRAYPAKKFRNLPGGSLMDEFTHDGVTHQYLLAFKDGRLWGVRVFVTDSAGVGGDIFGRLIRTKTKISGEGKGTGEAACPGFLPFQGAIWETDDTFEFMAQFSGKESQIRLARIDRRHLPHNRRLCDLVHFLKAETWEGNAGPVAVAAPPPRRVPSRPPRPVMPPPMPAERAAEGLPEKAPGTGAEAGKSAGATRPVPSRSPTAPSIVLPPGVDPYESAPDISSD